MALKTWTLNGEERWHISVVLETVTPLHIGSGEFCYRPELTNADQKPVDINACIKGANNLPIIPGSTVKGKLNAWLKARQVDTPLLEAIFGKGHNPDDDDQGSGGKVEFHDAWISTNIKGTSTWPYWQEATQTFIDAATAIDRHSRTALDASLHYTECVPPGVQFTLNITGVMQARVAALIIAALDRFDQHDDQPYFGAGDTNGQGRLILVGHLAVKVMGKTEIAEWLAQFNNKASDMAMSHARPLSAEEIAGLIKQGQTLLQAAPPIVSLGIQLQFAGPFLVNDPYAVKILEGDPKTKIDHYPLLDNHKKPRLPSASIRGVLRSQAERIIRSLGGRCCDTRDPCPSLYKHQDLSQLCLACQIFGAAGWKSVINISDFTCVDANELKTQEFIAIDRFHGGGKDGAKFDAKHSERPYFQGRITLSPRMANHQLEWGKGLLALVIRDLQEGDLSFGFGANKGYGALESVLITGIDQLQTDAIEAFRRLCVTQATAQTFITPTSAVVIGDKVPLVVTDKKLPDNSFHNPYHFIPTNPPDTRHWLPTETDLAETHHSHAFYRQQPELFHGQLICRLYTETPTFIGASKKDDTLPTELDNYLLNGQLAIPATSLRGMISSLAEAASNSAMRVLDNGLLSYRKDASLALSKIGITFINKKGQWQLIPMEKIKLKNAYNAENMRLFIEQSQSWSPEHNTVYYFSEEAGVFDVPQRTPKPGWQPGILRLLGKEGRSQELENKKHEWFIPVPENYIDKQLNAFKYQEYLKDNSSKAIDIPTPVLNRYNELAYQRTLSQKKDTELAADENSPAWLPFHLKGQQRQPQMVGKHLVYTLPMTEYSLVYYASTNKVATEISYSSIWRGRVQDDADQAATVNHFIPADLLPFNPKRTSLSPAELLFGFTELDPDQHSNDPTRSFAGKVRISAATLAAYPSDENDLLAPEHITLKALSSPKLPSPALYFRSLQGNNSNAYIPKHELNPNHHTAKGRKYYLHAMRTPDQKHIQKLSDQGHPAQNNVGKLPWLSHQETENQQLKVKIKPIKPKQSFYFQVDFNNLTAWELGLLCYALRPATDFRHRIGMGKPLGLGSVKIDILALQTLDRQKRYAQDSQDSARYNQHRWVNPSATDMLAQAGYDVIEPTAKPLVPKDLKTRFSQTMAANIDRALTLLGEPQHVKQPVHYPQVRDTVIEQESYQWFVANDNSSDNPSAAKQTLHDITETSEGLPTLIRHQKKKETQP